MRYMVISRLRDARCSMSILNKPTAARTAVHRRIHTIVCASSGK